MVTRRLAQCRANRLFGPLVVIVAAATVIATLTPLSCRRSTSRSLLLAIAVNCMIALFAMIIIAVGQMNLAVGVPSAASRRLLCRYDEVWGLPPVPAAIAAFGDRPRRRPAFQRH